MINQEQSISQQTRGVNGPRNNSELTSSSGSSTDSSGSSSAQGDGRVHQSAGLRTHTNNPQQHGSTSLQGMPPRSHITTHNPNTGIFTTRVEIRHEAIPDLIHSHMIPSHQAQLLSRHGQPIRQAPPGHIINQRGQIHVRHHPPRQVSRHPHRRRTRSRSLSNSDDEPCKAGCLSCLAASTSFRWILVTLSLLGVCCVVTGIVLAALHAAGNSFLFLAIMFIGLGVLLVVVVAVGWKCTPRGHEPIHALFGLGNFRHLRGRRTRRPHGVPREGERWYGGVMYPEFQYRRPPPSYNASLQDSLHQLAMAQSTVDIEEDLPAEDYSLPSSNPPSYRSRASTVRTGIQITFPPNRDGLPNSRPPTYRSHASTYPARPSLPHDMEAAGGDVAFTGPDDDIANINDVQLSRSHSRQASGNVIIPSAIIENSNGEPLDSIVQQTLQTLDDVTSSAEGQIGGNNEDDYPQNTAL